MRSELHIPRDAFTFLCFGRLRGDKGIEQNLKRMWTEHQRGVADHSTALWSLLMFELWAEKFLKAAPRQRQQKWPEAEPEAAKSISG